MYIAISLEYESDDLYGKLTNALHGLSCMGIHQVWAIGEVRKNHRGQVKLVPNSPLPPLYIDWQTFRSPEAADWETPHWDFSLC
ncbi:hypothetical protein RIF29_14308 [Crotalaria pallida]|uniref:Uncharacterized protein n=1 Tax=Crotalaria pallida TaxID=3830 RepID=A0AAN9FD44_CROPI